MKPLLLRGMLAVFVGILIGISLSLAPPLLADKDGGEDTLPWEQARVFAEVMQRIKQGYVDPVDDQALIEAAIRGMVADLDPHSAFLDDEEYREVRISTAGKYSGIGVEVGVEGDHIIVISPLDGGPAQRAGVRAGDAILSVDGLAVGPGDLADTVARLRGPSGTPVRLGIRRPGQSDPLSLELVRGQVEMHSVVAELKPSGMGAAYPYVRISLFNEGTGRELRAALSRFRPAGGAAFPGLVLDLRNNPGGVLEAAGEVADIFLDSGLIMSADGRMSDARFSIEATPGDLLGGAPIAVLVNNGSASASEIVAGALQDHGRATIVGESTYGKGSVQTIMPLSDGRALKLTTSHYYTPSGKSIHDRGVRPDVLVPDAISGEADLQLDRALQALQGRHIPPRSGLALARPRAE